MMQSYSEEIKMLNSMIPMVHTGNHAHLTKDVVFALFGRELQIKRELTVPHSWVYQERVTLRGPSGHVMPIAIVGPERNETSVEVHHSDLESLWGACKGIARGFALIGPRGEVILEEEPYTPAVHIHLPDWIVPEGTSFAEINSGKHTFRNIPVKITRSTGDWTGEIHIDSETAKMHGIRDGVYFTAEVGALPVLLDIPTHPWRV